MSELRDIEPGRDAERDAASAADFILSVFAITL